MMARLLCGVGLALALVSLSVRPHSSAETAKQEYGWVQAVAPGKGDWPRWNMPVVAFGNKLWMPQDSAFVGHSSNGIAWSRATSNAGWGERYLASVTFFDRKIWVMGGRNGPVKENDFRNDVWYTSDGSNWKLATPNAGWSPRAGHTALVYRNRLWVIGGSGAGAANDVWSSADGVSWTQVSASIPWSPRSARAFCVFADKMWVVGFRSGDDVWYSTDGAHWTQATDHAGWDASAYKHDIVFDGRMWVMGGGDDAGNFLNDVWYSSDGARWTQATAHAPWWPRATNYSVVFGDKLWIYGGKNGKDDVWYVTRRQPSPPQDQVGHNENCASKTEAQFHLESPERFPNPFFSFSCKLFRSAPRLLCGTHPAGPDGKEL